MTKAEAIAFAIDSIKGDPVEPGTIVATQADPIACTFVRYEGESAILLNAEGAYVAVPASEVIDANLCFQAAQHFFNLGWWTKDLRCEVIVCQKNPNP